MKQTKLNYPMSDEPIFDPEKLSIVDFKLIQGQIDAPEDFNADYVQSYHIENTLKTGFKLAEKLVKTDFAINIKTESKGTNKMEATGSFHLVYIFRVENLEELAVPGQNNTIDLHAALGNALSSITYSTSRGILLTRLQGTALQKFILPVINPNKLFHNK